MKRLQHLKEDNEKLNHRFSVLEIKKTMTKNNSIHSLKFDKLFLLKGSTANVD